MIIWPSTLPKSPLAAGLSRQDVDSVIRSQMDSGPPSSRRRYRGHLVDVSLSVFMTGPQKAIFEDWFRGDLAGGAFKFLWPSFGDEVVRTLQFKAPPSFSLTVPGAKGRDLWTMAGELLEYREEDWLAAINAAPSGALPSLVLDFVNDAYSLDGITSVPMPGTFSRPSAATVWDAFRIKSVPAGQPRFDRNTRSNAPIGLLIEEQRTNELLDSANFAGGGDWYSGLGFAIAPAVSILDGGTAWKHTKDGGGSISRAQACGKLWSQPETLSVWLEQGTSAESAIGIYDTTVLAFAVFAVYNWATGVATITQGTGTVRTTLIQTNGPNGGNVVRVEVTALGIGNDVSSYIYPCGTSPNSDDCIIHLAQYETGEAGSSYIPTTTAQVTRAADNLTLPVSLFPYNPAEGTFAIRGGGTKDTQWSLLGSTGSVAYRAGIGSTILRFAASGVCYGLSTPLPSSEIGFAMAADANGLSWSINGGAAVSSTTTVAFGTVTDLIIGSGAASLGAYNGHIPSLLYWPEKLVNSDLVGVSS